MIHNNIVKLPHQQSQQILNRQIKQSQPKCSQLQTAHSLKTAMNYKNIKTEINHLIEYY